MADHDIPPAISGLERQFLLATLIQKKDPDLGLDAALALANDLARLIDTVYTEDMDFSGLARIVPDTLAAHWQKTLEFLEIITEFWPLILAERGQIDPSDRRNRLLKSLATLWRNHPPDGPVIAAGSTGSIPSAGELLKTIAVVDAVIINDAEARELAETTRTPSGDTAPVASTRRLPSISSRALPSNSASTRTCGAAQAAVPAAMHSASTCCRARQRTPVVVVAGTDCCMISGSPGRSDLRSTHCRHPVDGSHRPCQLLEIAFQRADFRQDQLPRQHQPACAALPRPDPAGAAPSRRDRPTSPKRSRPRAEACPGG